MSKRDSEKEGDGCLTKLGLAVRNKHLKHIEELRQSGLSEEEIKTKLEEEKAWEKEYWYHIYMKDESKIVPHVISTSNETDMKTFNKIKSLMGEDTNEDEEGTDTDEDDFMDEDE